MDGQKLPALTTELMGRILYAMEDQDGLWRFSLSGGGPVRIEPDAPGQNDDLVALPSWTSKDGFALMVRYAEKRAPGALGAGLLRVLNSHRRGVFRLFKETLEEAGALEDWYAFKQEQMGQVIRQWYDGLGFEGGPLDTETGEDSLFMLEDFDLRFVSPDRLKGVPRHAGAGTADRAVALFAPDGSVAGYVSFGVLSSGAFVEDYWVRPEFRGNGLFSLMYERLSEFFEKEGVTMADFPVYSGFSFIANRFAATGAEEVRRVLRVPLA